MAEHTHTVTLHVTPELFARLTARAQEEANQRNERANLNATAIRILDQGLEKVDE